MEGGTSVSPRLTDCLPVLPHLPSLQLGKERPWRCAARSPRHLGVRTLQLTCPSYQPDRWAVRVCRYDGVWVGWAEMPHVLKETVVRRSHSACFLGPSHRLAAQAVLRVHAHAYLPTTPACICTFLAVLCSLCRGFGGQSRPAISRQLHCRHPAACLDHARVSAGCDGLTACLRACLLGELLLSVSGKLQTCTRAPAPSPPPRLSPPAVCLPPLLSPASPPTLPPPTLALGWSTSPVASGSLPVHPLTRPPPKARPPAPQAAAPSGSCAPAPRPGRALRRGAMASRCEPPTMRATLPR